MTRQETICIDTAFAQVEEFEQQQVQAELASMTEAEVSQIKEINPLDALAQEIEASQTKPGFGTGNLRDSKTHRSPRFNRNRFKKEVPAELEGEERTRALDRRKRSLKTYQNAGRTAFAHLDLYN